MIISKITLYLVRMPLRAHFETSFGRITTRDCLIVEAEAGGIQGYGECVADRDPGYSYETSSTAWHILKDFIAPAILHKNFESASDLQQELSFIRGHLMAKSAIEMAFWDMAGKQQVKSLQELIGGARPAVPVGVSVGLQDTPDELVKVVENYLSQGYKRIKIKIKPGRDFGDTQAVRKAFPDTLLQVDANSAYRLDTAHSLIPLDSLGLLLIEQPLADDDLWDHSQLQKQFSTPLCLDESILSVRHARQAIEMKACRVINIKTGRVGGLAEAIAIHDLCFAQSIPVWCGGMLETGVGRAANLALASLPGFSLPGDLSATDRYYDEDITNERFFLNSDSTINVPTEAGLGISIDYQSLEKYTLAKLVID